MAKYLGVSKHRLMAGFSQSCAVCHVDLGPREPRLPGQNHLCADHSDWYLQVVDSQLSPDPHGIGERWEEPRDQLGSYEGHTIEALRGLTDVQLNEQVLYWRMMKANSTGRSIMGYNSLLAVGQRVWDERHLRNPGTDQDGPEAAPSTVEDLPQSTS